MNEDAEVASSLHCPRAPMCLWESWVGGTDREHTIRADEASRWERTFHRLVTRVEQLEEQLRAEKAKR